MRNEVWSEIGTFLNGLRCGNVKRESYIQLSEVAEAEEQKKEAQKIFLKAMDSMETSKRKSIEDYMEKLKHLAFVEEEQAYCQGYVDCIQLLAGLGVLIDSPDIKKLLEKIKISIDRKMAHFLCEVSHSFSVLLCATKLSMR